MGRHWPSIGPRLEQNWPKTGPGLARHWARIGPSLGQDWPDTGPALARHWASIDPKWASIGPTVGQHWASSGAAAWGQPWEHWLSLHNHCIIYQIMFDFILLRLSSDELELLAIWWISSPIAGPRAFCNSGNAPDSKHICHYMASMIGPPLFA